MERFFILDKYNTFLDWDLILTSKDVASPELKTNNVDLDGMDGTLDLSEALTGTISYTDRTVSATFWTDHGTREERSLLLRHIRQALHGKKVKIIEPDDPEHYLYGRVKVKDEVNNRVYATFTIEAVCEPWRYTLTDIVRYIAVADNQAIDVVINNKGVKTLLPTVTVSGSVSITYDGVTTSLTDGTYTISSLKLYQGTNIVNVTGTGSVTFTYKEGDI
jgi:intracellular sulfur oxidation DsrE/DsrF family protein